MVTNRLREAVLLLLLLSAVFIPVAGAQDGAECVAVADTAVEEADAATNAAAGTDAVAGPFACADAAPYPGPFVDPPATRTGPLGWGVLKITLAQPAAEAEPDAADAEATEPPDDSAPIAHTGTEIFLLAYVGTGLVAFGAAALGTRRRYFVDEV